MSCATYRAVVAGPTGATGQALVSALLASPRCTGVTALVRSGRGRGPLPHNFFGTSEKLTVRTIDYEALNDEDVTGNDVLFSCLGFSGSGGSVKIDNPTAYAEMESKAGDPASGFQDPVMQSW
jgi:N-acetyl-gamma-glutamylphosphate reductase